MSRLLIKKVWCLLLIAFACLLQGAGAQGVPPTYSHPPTYEDFVRSTAKIDVTLYQQLRFTKKVIAAIQAGDEVNALTGAAAADLTVASRPCLWKALRKAPEEPRLWALACYSLWQDRETTLTRAQQAKDFEPLLQLDPALAASIDDTSMDLYLNLVQHWEAVDPDNLAALCVEASLHADRGEYEEVKRCLNMIESRPRYESYGSSLRKDIIRAAEFAGYSPLAARHLALGWLKPFMELVPLRKFLNEHPEFADSRHFLALSVTQANPQLFSERMIISFFSGQKASSERDDELLSYIRTFRTVDLPECRWVSYFDEVFEHGESEAIERLKLERNGLPGTSGPEDEEIAPFEL